MVATVLLLALVADRVDHRPALAQDLQLDDLPRHPAGLGPDAAAACGWRLPPGPDRVTRLGRCWAGFRLRAEPARAGGVRTGDAGVFRPLPASAAETLSCIAMLGAFLGPEQGIEAMLWTFVLGGCIGLIVLVWRVGPVALLGRVFRQIVWTLRLGLWQPLTEAERRQLQPPLVPGAQRLGRGGDRAVCTGGSIVELSEKPRNTHATMLPGP